jgi:hypothetical protein
MDARLFVVEAALRRGRRHVEEVVGDDCGEEVGVE